VVTAERYIREKTQLSRSGVMRILADLKPADLSKWKKAGSLKSTNCPPDTEFQNKKAASAAFSSIQWT
jgi:hypothetical protein